MKQKTYDHVEGKYLPEKLLFNHQHLNHCGHSFCLVPRVPSLKRHCYNSCCKRYPTEVIKYSTIIKFVFITNYKNSRFR